MEVWSCSGCLDVFTGPALVRRPDPGGFIQENWEMWSDWNYFNGGEPASLCCSASSVEPI